jgi:hypothetical protein
MVHFFVGISHVFEVLLLSCDAFRGCGFTGTRSPASRDHTIRSGEMTGLLDCLVIDRKIISRVVQGS